MRTRNKAGRSRRAVQNSKPNKKSSNWSSRRWKRSKLNSNSKGSTTTSRITTKVVAEAEADETAIKMITAEMAVVGDRSINRKLWSPISRMKEEKVEEIGKVAMKRIGSRRMLKRNISVHHPQFSLKRDSKIKLSTYSRRTIRLLRLKRKISKKC